MEGNGTNYKTQERIVVYLCNMHIEILNYITPVKTESCKKGEREKNNVDR